ncbi:histidine kinase [Glycomyces sp. A-F 0318]|uniref:sensor histidine kinase n=1 Tax=Glycomyces amatae TaxID=2881355 RepID=UPI001E49984B|nr:histidine kinase [Glycomyces amatae]MCD0444208.1 histidine kinase [Glycomyces amatae]
MTRRWAEALLVLGLFLAAVLAFSVEEGPPSMLALVLTAVVVAPVAARRRWPVAAFAVSFAALVIHIGFGYPHAPLLPALIVVLYAVLASTPRVTGIAIAIASGGVLSAVALASGVLGPVEVLTSFGWIGLAIAAAEMVKARRFAADAAEDRAQRAEQLAEEEAARRAAEERVVIARELHDVLAHSITVIGAQAAVARHLDEPESTTAAIAVIDDAARDAMEGLRIAIGVLRNGEVEPLAPAPTLEDLETLVDRAGVAGQQVTATVSGRPDPKPSPVLELCAFRIVQESLTNAAKHAPNRHVAVDIAYLPRLMRVRVTNDGHAEAAPSIRPGHGINGMTERARAIGGTLSAGPRAGGGFEVQAELPL